MTNGPAVLPVLRCAGAPDPNARWPRAQGLCQRGAMCRSIKTLRGAEPPPSHADAEAAALQFVRKISGYRSPSRANQEAFDRAVAEVTAATVHLLEDLQPARAAS